MKRIAAILLCAAACRLPAQACAVCFGAKGDRMTEVASWSILTLLAVAMVVLACIGVFIFTLARRSRLAAEAELHPPAGAVPGTAHQ